MIVEKIPKYDFRIENIFKEIKLTQTALEKLVKQCKAASRTLALKTAKEKNDVLGVIAKELILQRNKIKLANAKDIKTAEKVGLEPAMVDRLRLNDQRIEQMAKGVKEIIKLSEPTGVILEQWKRPNGIKITKRSVPIGLIGMIYEARPNVTIDASALCLKAGNACILRGGKEAINSNSAIIKVIQDSLKKKNFDPQCVGFVKDTDRALVSSLLQMNQYIDVIIPRGGKSLVKLVTEKSTIPVIKHYDGNCHIFVDKKAKKQMALDICINAKTQRPGVCNAAETFLIDQSIAKEFLPELQKALKEKGVEIRGCEKSRKILKGIKIAKQSDWYEEYLDLIVAIKIVKDVTEAVDHINAYGSAHSDCIVSQDKKNCTYFENAVESAVVFVNASTRFNDGFEFGFGAEIGISTDKLHARGPVGLRELTTYQYQVSGTGQIKK